MKLPPRQSGHRISNRTSNKPETMNTDTPETNEALAAILDKDGYLSEDNAPDVLVKLSRTMERERDNARERVDTMFAKFVDTLEQTRNERDEARVLADRLAALMQRERAGYGGQMVNPECDCCDCKRLKPIDEALATWKEARSES